MKTLAEIVADSKMQKNRFAKLFNINRSYLHTMISNNCHANYEGNNLIIVSKTGKKRIFSIDNKPSKIVFTMIDDALDMPLVVPKITSRACDWMHER